MVTIRKGWAIITRPIHHNMTVMLAVNKVWRMQSRNSVRLLLVIIATFHCNLCYKWLRMHTACCRENSISRIGIVCTSQQCNYCDCHVWSEWLWHELQVIEICWYKVAVKMLGTLAVLNVTTHQSCQGANPSSFQKSLCLGEGEASHHWIRKSYGFHQGTTSADSGLCMVKTLRASE